MNTTSLKPSVAPAPDLGAVSYLDEIATFGVLLPKRSEVEEYLGRFPEVAAALPPVCDAVRQELSLHEEAARQARCRFKSPISTPSSPLAPAPI